MRKDDSQLEVRTEVEYPNNFCGDCGLSLKLIEPICQSRICEKCDRRAYFQRHALGGGFRVEEGEQFHITELKLSLEATSTMTQGAIHSFTNQDDRMKLEYSIF